MTAQKEAAGTMQPVPPADTLREFHAGLPLSGDPPNALLLLPDELLQYLVAAVRNAPCLPPAIAQDEWDRFIDLLDSQAILPLLAYHVQAWPEACRPPQEICARLDAAFMQGAARNLLIGRQVQTVLFALQDKGIPVLLVKGLALAYSLYPDPALRQSSDIDLMVRPEHVDACDAVLRDLGYTCPVRWFRRSDTEHHHDNYSPPGPGVAIELHWTPGYVFHLFPKSWLDDAFARKIPVVSAGISGYTLHPSDHLLYLVFHNIFQHYHVRIDWMGDMARLMESLKTPDDWTNLKEQCVKMHLVIPMEQAIIAAHLWSSVKIPERFLDLSAWPAPSAEDTRLWEHATKRRRDIRSLLFLKIRGLPGIRKKLQFIWHFIFMPKEKLVRYRKSASLADIPLAHLRRWYGILKFR
jgi:hypothetical protein